MSDIYQAPESELLVEPDQSKPLKLQLASRWARLAAYLIDSIIIFIPIYIMLHFIYSSSYEETQPFFNFDEMIIFDFVWLPEAIGLGFFLMVNIYFMYTKAQTIGKLICGIIVVDFQGHAISGNRYLFIRLLPMWFISYIPIVGGVIILVDTLCIFRHEKNCLHDDIAKTRVVSKKSFEQQYADG